VGMGQREGRRERETDCVRDSITRRRLTTEYQMPTDRSIWDTPPEKITVLVNPRMEGYRKLARFWRMCISGLVV
jgi:hypothetical protein